MARSIGEILPGIIERAQRIATLSEFVATFDCPSDRKDLVMQLYAGGIITSQTAELMLEHFGLEAA